MARLRQKSRFAPQFDLSTKEGLASFAKSRGFEKEAEEFLEEPKLSLMQRLGRFFTSFETANALYENNYNDKSFITTYAKDIAKDIGSSITGTDYRTTPKKTWKDILMKEGMKDRPGKIDTVDVVGLAGDIVTDPTTWAGGFVTRLAGKGGKVGFKISKKLPVVGKRIAQAEDVARGLFQPLHKVKKLGKAGKEYAENFMKFAKGRRALTDDFLTNLTKKAKKVKGIPRAGERIAEAIETGTKTGNKLLDEAMDGLVKTQKALTKQEVKRGILKKELPNYMHHMLTEEAADFVTHGGDLSRFLKPIRVKLGAAKGRKIPGIVKEINEKYQEKLGFNLFEENAFKAFAKRGLDSVKAVETFDFMKRIGNQFGKEATEDFVDEVGVKWVKSTASGISEKALGDMRFPEPIAKHIDEFRKVLTNDKATNKVLQLHDKLLRFWKGSVTGWFPSFHTRNAMGGVFNNWLAGLNNPKRYLQAENILRGKKGIIKTATGDVSYNAVRKMLKEYGVSNQAGYLDVAEYLQKEVAPSLGQKAARFPQKAMSVVEDRLRTPLFLDSLAKGASPQKAAAKVIKYHFDYMPEGFTAFERHVMKRVIPFYTWTRHNIPLQLEQMIMQPAKYAGVMKTFRSVGPKPSTEEEAILPTWLRERFTVKGEGGYWSGFGLPVEEAVEKLAHPMRGFGISLSPFIKTPIERLTGYNIFKERMIEEDTYGKHFRNMPKPFKKWLQLKEQTASDGDKYYTVNPNRKYWLEAIGSRGLATALRIANHTDDKKNLLSLITMIRKYNYSVKDLKRWSETEQREELEKRLQEAGELQEFKRTFIPK